MTLQQLRYVVMVADAGTITEAANRLYISQPSLTNAIHELEKEMGINIFNRSNKGISPSIEGEVFLGYARQVLEQAKVLEDKYKGDDGGKITVRGEKKGDDIYISVEDNGMGMSEDVARNILVDNNKVPKHGSGVGVINVHSRIKLMFGSEYGLKVYSEPDEGTKVVIHIPAIPYTEENRERLERQDFGRGMVTDEEE